MLNTATGPGRAAPYRFAELLSPALLLLGSLGLAADIAPRPATVPSPGTQAASPALPQADHGIAARYPGDKGIEGDPAVLFHDDFESGQLKGAWDGLSGRKYTSITEIPADVHGGVRALQMTIPQQKEETGAEIRKLFQAGHDVLFFRYYSKFDKEFDQLKSSHNGAYIAAIGAGVPEFTAGTKVTGRDKFMVTLENWRGEPAVPSPGHLNVYCYHPEQGSGYGDHFFPTGIVFFASARRPGDFGPQFVSRPDIIPDLGRWYCYEYMVKANTPGQRDGRIAVWLDGRLVADFMNLRLRDVDTLKINVASIGLHIKSNTIRGNSKWYDDVVIATSYIGPMKTGN